MSLFRIPTTKETNVENPVLLFRDLKRDPTIKFLWGHQEKVLDSYHGSHLESKDLALELPTGTGKTLVGLMIAEYRRQSRGQRVAFLCSTKQLCAQVHSQAQKYGVPTSLLTGNQSGYDDDAFYSYQQAKAVAVSTYSGVFNTNPRICDPNVIICDDAHAAENFISEMWTLTIEREAHRKMYDAVYALVRGLLTDALIHRLENPAKQENVVELVSPIALAGIRKNLADAILAFLDEYSSLKFAWKLICQHLSSCNLYFSADLIEIRPVLPPTLTHAPFVGATQRIYMSATLGEDGDLERTFGIKSIPRLPVPEGWDKRGTGRRLILFPELSSKVGSDFLKQLLPKANRTLILVPNTTVRQDFCGDLPSTVTVLNGADVEAQVEEFRRHTGPVALVLANRYDGIDFPGDDCRCLVICHLPKGASLQELFFTQRLKAFLITRDRIRTRVTQAMGRCTRDESDYSVVIVFGEKLLTWFCTQENLVGMHPELQAEASFGLENSKDRPTEKFLELCESFLNRTPDWDEAEKWIKVERARCKKFPDSGAATLQKAAEFEIDFNYALWNGLFQKAYEHADRVLSCLSGGEEMRSYRCFWQHQAAVAAFLTWKQTNNDTYRDLSSQRLQDASKGNFGIEWLTSLSSHLNNQAIIPSDADFITEWFSEIENLLHEVAVTGSKYDRTIAEKRAFILCTEAKKFHQGLEFLGRLLGARVHECEGDAKPDGFWNLLYRQTFVFEAKTDEFAPGAISMKTVRQALTHERSVRLTKYIPENLHCNTIVISPRQTIETEAQKHAGNLYYCSHEEIIKLFEQATLAFTELRILAPKHSQDLLPNEAAKIYKKHHVFGDDVGNALLSKKLGSLPNPGKQIQSRK